MDEQITKIDEQKASTAVTQQPSELDILFQNQIAMQKVIDQMKEIPILPSEVPKDPHGLERVEFPEEGGVLTYMVGYTEPYRGFPFSDFVDKIDSLKKIARATMSGLFHALRKRSKLQLALLIFTPFIIKDLVRSGLYTFYRSVVRFKLKPTRYSKSVRELYRALSVEHERDTEDTIELRFMVRDVLCMFLEFDNAYRFRLQDVLVEMDNEAMARNPVKEMRKLMDILMKREKLEDIRDTWVLCKLAVSLYLRFIDRELLTILSRGLSAVDRNLVALTVEDKYYCRPRVDYNFRFSHEEAVPVVEKPTVKLEVSHAQG